METPLFVALTRFDLVQVAAVYGAFFFTVHMIKIALKVNRFITGRRQPKGQSLPRAERM